MLNTTNEDLQQMREFVNHPNWPFKENWPTEYKTNCISFSLGIPLDNATLFRNIFSYLNHEQDTIKDSSDLLNSIGFKCRRISSISEKASDEYAIIVFAYDYMEYDTFQVCEVTKHEIHFVRVEPDGTWVHKFGWHDKPSITNFKEIHDVILEEDGVDLRAPSALFAISRP